METLGRNHRSRQGLRQSAELFMKMMMIQRIILRCISLNCNRNNLQDFSSSIVSALVS
jgi:hypothetical protein